MSMVVHLLGHAVDPSSILVLPRCRGALLAAVEEGAEIWAAEFHAYALSERYLHLVLTLPAGNPEGLIGSLRACIQRTAQATCGGVSVGTRFAYSELQGDAGLLDAVCYTHRASSRCGLVARPVVDAWSSLRAYQGCEPLLRPLRLAPVLEALGRCADPADAYAVFMDHARAPQDTSEISSKEPPAARAQDPGPPRTVRRAQGWAEPEPPLHPGERRRRVRSA